jgi:hypothetical protein
MSAPINWTPVTQYIDKLRDWNDRFDLGLTEAQIDNLAVNLPDHAGSCHPTGISLMLGKGIQCDWKVAMQVLQYELSKVGVLFKDCLDSKVSYYSGSEEPIKGGEPQVDVALLDTTWTPTSDIVPCQMHEQYQGQPLPGLEVAWLMALNPQIFNTIDHETVPAFLAPGLVSCANSVPVFDRGDFDGEGEDDMPFVGDVWFDDEVNDCCWVVFRP